MELLSPAGSKESLIAAVNAGADAVYMGGIRFGARAYADNPDTDGFTEALKYAHRYGAKVYMTVNTLLKPDEIYELTEYLKPYYEAGVDAVIVQDLGALSVIRREYPDLPVHASTQMTVTNNYGAQLMKDLGLTRIVPARELSLEEIKNIKDNVDIEIETFVHGALCYSYSGQCLMSSFIGGRSGNRGRCAQACRLEYALNCPNGDIYEGNLLSLKDLCCISMIPELAEAGIDSFKIEGRMKSPRYTAGVTEVWRKYIDLYRKYGADGFHVDKKDMQMIAGLFDRGGRTEGYYHKHNGPDMMAWEERADRRNNEELYAYLDDKYVNSERKIKLDGHAEFHAGSEAVLTVAITDCIKNTGDTTETELTAGAADCIKNIGDATETALTAGIADCKKIIVTGDKVETAVNRAMTEADLRKQLEKTGGSFYEWNTLTVDADEGIFIPVSKLNALRREAFEKVEEEVQKKYVRS